MQGILLDLPGRVNRLTGHRQFINSVLTLPEGSSIVASLFGWGVKHAK